MLAVEFAQLSDFGKSRDHNEDCLGFVAPETDEEARSRGWLFALADGVGGHDHGEVASETAIAQLREGFKKSNASEQPGAMLLRLVREANVHVYETAKRYSPGGSNMATTVVTCALRHDRVAVAHAGDSRCYLIRSGVAGLLTRDHTVANEHLRMGVLSPGEAAVANTRHLLARSLGSDLFLNVDLSEHQIFPRDVLLLCSDGMHNSVASSEMAAIAGNGGDLSKAAQRLIELANDRDGSDNISVLIIRIQDVERVGMYRGRPYVLR